MTRLARSHQKRSVTKATRFILAFVATILFGTILLSVSSAHKKDSGRYDSASASADVNLRATKGNSEGRLNLLATGGANKTVLSAFLPQAGPSPEVMETFAVDVSGNCDLSTPKSAFILGEKVCAKLSGGPPLSLYPRKFAWISNSNVIFQTTNVVTDPQTDIFMLPVLDPNTDYRGVWRVVDMSANDGSVRTAAYFSVSNPALPAANLAIYKSNDTDGSITAGSNILFSLYVTNYGPDKATNVTITDDTPANTTFVTDSGTASTGINCTFPSGPTGTTSCTIASFPQGASGKITLVVNVNSGTSPGTTIENTATISGGAASGSTPATCNTNCDPYTLDNTATSDVTVVAGVSGPTCTLSCPASITTFANTTEGGQRGAHVTYDDPTAAGNCGSVSSTPASGSFFPVGTTTVTATSETGGGMCSFDITVEEGSNVTISCPANETADADSNCSATVNIGSATGTGDNVTFYATRSDGQPVYNCDANGNCTRLSSDAPFSAGTTTITWFAYSHDVAGPYTTPGPNSGDTFEEQHRTGSASCTQTVTVNDVTPPIISATDSTASADANCQAPVPDYSSTVSDNCACASSDTSQGCADHSRITYTQSPAAGTLVGLGPHTVHITANDGSSNNNGAGNTSTKDVTFTVNDTTAPTINCPANITTGTDPGQCYAMVNPGTATATDNCDSNPTIAGTRSDNQSLSAPYPKGTTTITWTATDASGNHSSCTQTVTVNDTEAPTVSCPANVTRSTDPGTCSATFNPGTAEARDNCDSNPTVTGTRSDGQPLTAPYPKGTTVVTWTATDSSGNSSTSCAQTITVNDTEAPVISCPANITHGTDPGTCSATINPGTATATDNCDTPTVTGTRSDGQALNAPYPKGTTTITWTATDGSGNHSSCTQTITVNDTEAPAISCPANITRSNDPGMCSANINPGTATATDNCGSATVSGTRSDGGPLNGSYPVGTTTITWTATDTSGNHSSCTQTVTVNDTEPPQISCPSSFTLEPTCPSGAVGNYPTPVGTDNCPGATTTLTAGESSGSVFPIGTTTVTYTVTDAHGNSTSCSFTVTVKTPAAVIQDLINRVQALMDQGVLSQSNGNGLQNKLHAAQDAVNSGNTGKACSDLDSFIDKVQGYIQHGTLTSAQGQPLIDSAVHAQDGLGCKSVNCT